ncbi:family 43 glycosylhydrolase [Nibricoccus aquaticus]|nr:family 43 glycosylhydrolase [Nibricoccus aquaticus]
MKNLRSFFLVLIPLYAYGAAAFGKQVEVIWETAHAGNPVLPGYFADPSVLVQDGKFFVYATNDPWGGETLGCWESADFKQWTFRALNWPTKAACTSATSKGAMVWAPSVVRAKSGEFFMYVSVGSEVWVGVADAPLGPWKNALGDKPLIAGNWKPEFHMIDAEAFVDADGSAYLYWGSGWNWTNGRCFAVKLKADMVTFDGEPRDVTPANYFEAPFMVKQGGKYFLTYSNGKTISDTYEVRAAVGDSPLGPFVEIGESPILASNMRNDLISPGHHAVFAHGGKSYIAYHRHRLPFEENTAFRQVCVDELTFTDYGTINKVVATHSGPAFVQGRAMAGNLATTEAGAVATASSVAPGQFSGAARVIDDNYATLWTASAEAKGGWLQLDLGATKAVKKSVLRFEYAWKKYAFTLESSADGKTWKRLSDQRAGGGVSGSPVTVEHAGEARYLRIVFPGTVAGKEIGVIEWAVF